MSIDKVAEICYDRQHKGVSNYAGINWQRKRTAILKKGCLVIQSIFFYY
jgi:hypothetical protein